VLGLASVFVVICKDDVECLKSIGGAIIPTFYLPNCVDVKKFQSSIAELPRTKIKNGSLEVLFLGGSDAVRKGLPELLLTLPALAARFPELRFRLVAVPADFVESLVPKVYRDRYIVEGWVSGQAKFERLAKAAIFVLPTHAEGMPIAILEAMASSLPVVASRVAGIPDMIRNGQEGLLVPCGDIPALTEAISKLIDSRDLRREMGSRAFERVSSEYDLPIGTEGFRGLYNSLLCAK
jgi:glycosyltransferase involved in cell wall biosynthesis